MTPDRKQELAEQMGLSAPPKPRYEDLPVENNPINQDRWMNFRKMVSLCNDSILTNSFWRFIPDRCVIDHTMDPYTYSGENCFAIMIRTDVPPPVNEAITRKTGIRPSLEFVNYLLWMGVELEHHWTALHPRAMAPPLLCRGYPHRHGKRNWGAHPFLGMAMKFDLRPPDGLTVNDVRPQYGALIPMNLEDRLKADHVVMPEVPQQYQPDS